MAHPHSLLPTLLLALTAPALVAGTPVDPPDPLSPAAVEATTTRAWLVRGGQLAPALSCDCCSRDHSLSNPEQVAVVDRDNLRVVHCAYGICTVAAVEEDALLPVPTTSTRIRADGDAFVEVAAGTRLELPADFNRDAADPIAVTFDIDGVQARGELQQADLGPIYESAPWTLNPSRYLLTSDARITAEPGGEVIATISLELAGWRVTAEILDEDRDGFTEVLITDELVRMRGWLPSEVIVETPDEYLHASGSSGGGWGCSHCRIEHLPSGIHLHAEPDGPVIGRTHQARTRVELATSLDPDPDGWIRVEYPSIFGQVIAYLPPATSFLD